MNAFCSFLKACVSKDSQKLSEKSKCEVIINDGQGTFLNSESTDNRIRLMKSGDIISCETDKLYLSPIKKSGSNPEVKVSFDLNEDEEENLKKMKFGSSLINFSYNSAAIDGNYPLTRNNNNTENNNSDFGNSNLFTYSVNSTESNQLHFMEQNYKGDSKLYSNLQMHNLIILDNEIQTANKLLLQDEEGELLWKKLLIIDASGLQTGLRKKRDGFTFFGPDANYRKKMINDFVLNYSNEEIISLFTIYYDRPTQKYFFKNCSLSKKNKRKITFENLIFKKVTQNQIMKKEILCLGQFLLSIELIKLDSNSNSLIPKIKINLYCTTAVDDIYSNTSNTSKTYYGDKASLKSFTFTSEDSPITIGRSNCKVNLESNYLSKKHCAVYFEDGKWCLSDGYMGKISKNGLWILINQRFEIENNTKIKIGNNIINIDLLQ